MKQARAAAAYEKMALRINDWMVEQGYEPFGHVVEVAEKRYRLELLKKTLPSYTCYTACYLSLIHI